MKRLLKRLLTLPRWASFPFVLFALGGLIAAGYPGGLSAAYADLRDAHALNASIEKHRDARSRMNDRLRDVQGRVEFKEELVTALIHGDVSLAVVSAEFEAMNGGDEQMLRVQRLRHGDVPPTELAARNVLEYVRVRTDGGGGTSVVMTRLEGEYTQLFGRPAPTR